MQKPVLTIKDMGGFGDGPPPLSASVPRGWTIVGLALLAWVAVVLAIVFAFGFIPFLPAL